MDMTVNLFYFCSADITFAAMRIFLVGYMGSGKTRTGKLLARAMNYGFMDVDELFEERYRISCRDFFKKYDEEAFRKLEHQLLSETILRDNVVYSMGGGTPCFYDNMDMLNRYGLTVYIKLPALALYHRLKDSKKQRPILHRMAPDDLLPHIESQLLASDPFYSRAALTVDGINLNINELVQMIRLYTAAV
ncbi:MAG: shikimate kinase [Bacteroidales bacterium]|nr:shikimate kinase [Bacteroidales bacterium]